MDIFYTQRSGMGSLTDNESLDQDTQPLVEKNTQLPHAKCVSHHKIASLFLVVLAQVSFLLNL